MDADGCTRARVFRSSWAGGKGAVSSASGRQYGGVRVAGGGSATRLVGSKGGRTVVTVGRGVQRCPIDIDSFVG